MKGMWDFNDRKSLIKHWTKVEIEIVKEYQRDVNQFGTRNGVISNWLRYIFHKSTTEELHSNTDETDLPMADEGYFGECIYFKITLEVMFWMTTKVVQALHDYTENFGRSGVASELVEK